MYIDEIKYLYKDNINQIRSIIEDIANALLGNPVSLVKTLKSIANAPFFIREQLFWNKFFNFLNGIASSDDDLEKFRTKLSENGTELENAMRLITLIDRAETQKKVQYIINATMSLISDRITLSSYFRICHSIIYTIDEDLLFMTAHIHEDAIPMNIHVQGLMASGLMYYSSIPAMVKYYSFTEIAHLIDKYAITCDYHARYPNSRV